MSDLQQIGDKIQAGEALCEQDATALYQATDLLELGRLAQLSCGTPGRKVGSLIEIRRVRYSNICRNQCRHCDRSIRPDGDGGFTRSVAEVVDLVGEAVSTGIDQIQLTGGSNPDPPYDYYLDLVSSVRTAFPGTRIQGFAPEQVANIGTVADVGCERAVRDLRDAGLDSLLEDGADIFDYEIRNYLCPAKSTGGMWLHIMREAHQLGMYTGASMLYGHYEGPEAKAEHLSHLDDLQDETGAFTFFAPRALRRSPNIKHGNGLVGGAEDMREFAVSRIFLNGFPHLRCYANDLGMKTTQMALHFGVDTAAVLIRDDEPLDDAVRADLRLPNATQLRELMERVLDEVVPAPLDQIPAQVAKG